MARLRAAQNLCFSAVGETEPVVTPLPSNIHRQADHSSQVEEMTYRNVGDHQSGAAAMLQVTAMPLPVMGFQFKGSCSRDAGSNTGQNLSESDSCMKLIHGEQAQYETDPSVAPNHVSQPTSVFIGDGDGYALTHVDNVAGKRVDEGYVDTDQMELEGGGEASVAF